MKTKTLMSKVTLGAALVLTTAAVVTTVVVPNVVRADDTSIVDKNKELFTVYGPLGTEKMSYNNLYDENGVVYPDFAKLRDFEYTRVNTEGVWFVGPNGERNYDPNAVKPEPTTPSTTEPTTPSTTEPTTPSTTDNTQTTASSATPAKTNQLPVTGESNLISTIMGITGLTLLLSWFGFKAYRESK